MTATATPPPTTPVRKRPKRAGRPSAPLLSAPAARIVTLTALGAYAALRWSTLVTPSGAARMLLLLVLALAAAVAVGQLTRLPPLAQAPAAVAVVLVWAAASMIGSGVPVSLVLEPNNWDDLGLGLQQGIEQLPRVLVPYGQPDEWPRIAILLGGALLLALGCVLGLSPGRRGVPLRHGAPFGGGIGLRIAAATPLIAAAIVPPVIMEPSAPVLEGLALFVLLSAFLWLERLQRSHVPPAEALLVLAALGGAVAVPWLDRDEPWVDAQALVGALDRPDPARFDWSQSYGPLDWPRTGREVLRIQSPVQTYWKAQNLDGFDGVRWVRSQPQRPTSPLAEVPLQARRNGAWTQSVQVTLRDFSTSEMLGAGTTIGFEREPTSVSPGASPGTWVSDEPLEPGDGYVAKTIEPRPRQTALLNAGTEYPELVLRYLLVGLPQQDGPGDTDPGRFRPGAGLVFVPPFGTAEANAGPQAYIAERDLAASPYRRAYALARQLASESSSPYEYQQRVLAYLRDGFTYSETPPRRQLPLEAFLFRDRVGYCQQFAGAAALLLRLGGVPARVAAGFTSGSRDGARDEYVVRDYDAHAWIEVWYPQIGWVRSDPTPTTAPARSGRAPRAAPTRTVATPAPQTRAPEPTPAADTRAAAQPSSGGGSGWPAAAFVALALVVVLLAAGGLLVRRSLGRPRDADTLLAELQRALRRTGRPPEPQLTLLALERRMHDSPDAAGYVRAVRLARFGGGVAAVTPRQRRALRAELARGLGLGGRLRALFALPPRWGR